MPGAVLLAFNLALLALFVWAEGESHPVRITVTANGMTALVDGTRIALHHAPLGRNWALVQPAYDSYRQQATGEAAQTDLSTPLGRLGMDFRLLGPGPAFTRAHVAASGVHLSVKSPGRAPTSQSTFRAPRTPFTLSFDLQRPDGTAVVLAGLDSAGNGYALLIRYDQPDAYWARWSAGAEGTSLRGATLSPMSLVPSLQRALRVFLLGYLFALVLLSLSVGTYACLMAALAPLGTAGSLPFARVTRHPATAFLIGTTLAALVVSSLISTYLLGRVPHVQDSVAYLFQAHIFDSGRLAAPAPPTQLQKFFSEEFVPYYHGLWFSQYPPGHPLVLALFSLLGVSWLSGPITASLAIGILGLVALSAYSRATAILAVSLAASSPFWLLLGSSFMSHPTGLLFTVLALWGVARSQSTPARGFSLLFGFSSAMLFLTREFTAVLLLIPFVLDFMWRRRHNLGSALPALLGALPPLLFLAAYNQRLMGNPLANTYSAWNRDDLVGFGVHSPVWGTFTLGDGLWNTYLNLTALLPHASGWPYGLALAFLALPFITGRATRWDYLLLSSLLLLILGYSAYWASGLMYGPRYYYEGMPALVLLTARGILILHDLPTRLWRKVFPVADRAAALVFPALLLVGLLLFSLRFYWPSQLPLYKGYNYVSDAELRLVSRHHLHNALVFVRTEPSYAWWEYGSVFFANSPFLNSSVIYAHDLGTADPELQAAFPVRSAYLLSGSRLIPLP